MKYISDKDLGIDCDFVSKGETNSEVINSTARHVKEHHAEEYERIKPMMSSHIWDDEDEYL